MKILTLIGCLFAISLVPALRAGGAANAKRLAELQALSFSTVREAYVARLSAPTKKEEAAFHGCALRSGWKEIPEANSHAIVGALRNLIRDHIAACSKAGDADVVWLEPIGFVYGEYGVRLETDHGKREFSITCENKDGYVYAYDATNHCLCLVMDGGLQEKLGQSLASQSPEPTR